MKPFHWVAFDVWGTRIGSAAVVRTGRRSGQWRVEVGEYGVDFRRLFVDRVSEAVCELILAGAVRLERQDL